MEREHNIEETEKKQKAKQLAKSSSNSKTSGGFSKKKKLKKNKSKSKPRPANTSCHTCGEKGYYTPEYSKKRESKTEQTKSGSSAYIAIKLSRNQEIQKNTYSYLQWP